MPFIPWLKGFLSDVPIILFGFRFDNSRNNFKYISSYLKLENVIFKKLLKSK